MSIQFNNTATKRGLIQICETTIWGDGAYGKISDNNDRLLTFTSLLNDGLDRTVTKILGVDTKWQFDDTNYTTIPVGKADLVDGQQIYTLDLDTTGLLKITGADIRDSSGLWTPLYPVDEKDFQDRGTSAPEFYKDPGIPRYYDLRGNAITLYPAPRAQDVTLEKGLRIAFQRVGSYFQADDKGKTPGIPPTFHKLVAYYATEEYTINNLMVDKATLIRDRLIVPMEREMDEHFAKRDKDTRPRLTMRNRTYR